MGCNQIEFSNRVFIFLDDWVRLIVLFIALLIKAIEMRTKLINKTKIITIKLNSLGIHLKYMKRYSKFLLANFMASELSYWIIVWHPTYPIGLFLFQKFIHYCCIKENQ